MAMWSSLFTKAARSASTSDAPRPPAEATRRLWASPFYVRSAGSPYRSGWDLERAITEGMLRSIWTYKAVDSIATSIAGLNLVMPRGSYDAEEVVDPRDAPKILRRLNFRTSPQEFAFAFRYRAVAQFLMSKKGVFIEYERDGDGEIDWLYLLNPDKVAPIPHETKFVDGFEVWNNGSPDVLPNDRVLWIRNPHPTDPYASLTPLEAAGLSIDLDYYARLYNRNFMANDGRPGGILSVKGPIPDADVEILRGRFESPKPGAVSVIESDGMSFADLSTTPRDAAYGDLSERTKVEVLTAFGVGESVIGNASGRTYDNADAEEANYWRVTCGPKAKFFDMHLSSLTPGADDDDLWIRHDTSTVEALQRPVNERRQRVIERFREGTATLNHVLAAHKEEELDLPAARAYFLPAGKVAVAVPEDLAEIQKLKVVGAEGGAEPPAPALPPGGYPSRIGSMLANRRLGTPSAPVALPATATVRSPERSAAMAASEAQGIAERRDAERLKADAPAGHYAVMLPVAQPDAQHLWRHSPVRPTEGDPHITVAMFDAPSPEAAMTIAERWATGVEPIKVVVGLTSWVWDNGEERPFVAGVRSDSLHEAREALEALVVEAGGEMAGRGKDDYQPHFTIAYLKPGQPDPVLSDGAVVAATITAAELSTPGGDRRVTLPLTGGGDGDVS